MTGSINSFSAAGATWLVFGRNDPPSVADRIVGFDAQTPASVAIRIGGPPGELAGLSVDICEDFNGDGYDDIAIGAFRADPGGSDSGAAYIVFGRANPVAMELAGLASRPAEGFIVIGDNALDWAGYSLSSAGDFNGDGYGDLIVSAQSNDEGGNNAGAAYVIFGRPGPGATVDLGNLGGAGFKIVGAAAFNFVGASLSGLGDVNGDGYDDIVVGASARSRAYVIFGRAATPVTINLGALAQADGFVIEQRGVGNGFSSDLGRVGDTNGDGFDDILIGSSNALTGGIRTGAAYLIYGRATAASTVNTAGNDVLAGTAADDLIDASAGGDDSVNGGAGNDGFRFGTSFTGADRVDGGNGANDQIGLHGDYTGANALVLRATTIENIEVIALLPGGDYDITTVDANLAPGETLTIYATQLGESDNFTFNGSAELNRGKYILYGGFGVDNLTGGAGDDGFYFGHGRYGPNDVVNGGAGTNDQLALDGSYGVGFGQRLVLSGSRISGIEVIALLQRSGAPANEFDLTADEALIGAGQTLTIWGLLVQTSISFRAASELDGGAYRFFGGSGDDFFLGGRGDDWFHGGAGSDELSGFVGSDTFAYTAVSQSTGVNADQLLGFNDNEDRIDLPGTVAGFAAPASGTLSLASFDADLANAVNAALGPNQAIVLTANGAT